MSSLRLRTRRAGQSLLLILLLLIVLAGILALTLDFGFVLQSRRLMQTGVNASALEGLRDLDVDLDGFGDGRENSAKLMRNVFDDDMNPNLNTTTVGAGISSRLVQGSGFQQTSLGNGTGSRDLFENRSNLIYRPNPQLNSTNLPQGDMVAGNYDDLDTGHREFSDYLRDDFFASMPGDDFSSFLVRLRRTHDPDGLDRIPGVSSGDGGLPLLMGRLSWLSEQPAGAAYSVRRDGILVRAAAIADEKVAVKIWPSNNAQVYSAIQFGISKADFISQSNLGSSIQATTTQVTEFGQLAEFAASGSYSGELGYVAVIDETLSPSRAIGFFLVETAPAPQRHSNCSSRVQDAWATLGELTALERSSLYTSRQEVLDTGLNDLLTHGALVRTIR